MNSNLCNKLDSLSPKDRSCFFNKVAGILSDEVCSCYFYGLSREEYVNPPKEKIEAVEERIYEEMFGSKILSKIPLMNISTLNFANLN
jgi:hypothetical protein